MGLLPEERVSRVGMPGAARMHRGWGRTEAQVPSSLADRGVAGVAPLGEETEGVLRERRRCKGETDHVSDSRNQPLILMEPKKDP